MRSNRSTRKPRWLHHIQPSFTPASFFVFSIVILPLLAILSAVLRQKKNPMNSETEPSNLNNTASTPDECIHPAFDNCSFYASCLETRYNCGATGYPIRYGQHFCQAFRNERSKFSVQGQAWMLNTMHCLQIALVQDVTTLDHITCAALEDKAFACHTPCYINNGLCTLSPKDWLAILDIVHLKTIFQDWDAFTAALQTAEDCVAFWAFLIEQRLV